MQAAIHTSAGQQWAAAVWVFNHVLQRVADVLARQGHVGLAAQLISAKNSQAPRISEFRLSDLSVQDRIFSSRVFAWLTSVIWPRGQQVGTCRIFTLSSWNALQPCFNWPTLKTCNT